MGSGIDWDKDILQGMYDSEGLTLQEIGDKFGVSRERIRQVMESYELHRNTRRSGGIQYETADDYFAKERKNDIHPILYRLFEKERCSVCGRKESLVLHHKQYPARSKEDLEVVCQSCHIRRHKGMKQTNIGEILQQIQTRKGYTDSQMAALISKHYKCSRASWNQVKNGKTHPTYGFIIACIKAFDIGHLTLNRIYIENAQNQREKPFKNMVDTLLRWFS